jgi:hypothetical protein
LPIQFTATKRDSPFPLASRVVPGVARRWFTHPSNTLCEARRALTDEEVAQAQAKSKNDQQN